MKSEAGRREEEVIAPDREAELIERARRGDRRAQGALVDRYGSDVYRFCTRYFGNRSEAQDAAQDALVAALTRIGQFRADRGTFRNWLFRIAANLCLNEFRRRRHRASQTTEGRVRERLYPRPVDAGMPAEALAVRQALAELEDRDRSILLLAYYHGFTYREIASILDVRLGTVKSRLSRALSRLRRLLAPQER